MRHIFLITDYRGMFYSTTRSPGVGFNLEKLKKYFFNEGFKLVVKSFAEINLREEDYLHQLIIYQSSEDPELFYKDYIEDILFGLKEQGAVLIPDLKYFRAHHNKVFMEVLRDISSNQSIRNIKSFGFGTFEDYLKFFNYSGVYVLKSSDTSKSKGVYLIKNYLDTSKVKKLSKTFSFQNLRYLYRSVRKFKKHLFISNYRKKFILQEYIPNLSGDYRVIVYGNKYYVLYRKNRINDFRASGSMRFYFGTSLPDGLLNFSKEVFQSFHVPFIALDIGEKNGAFYLFEFQAVSFGQYTFEKSSGYYFKQGESWVFKKEKPDLESEFVTSIVKYLKDNNI